MHWIVHPGLRKAVDDFLDYERLQVLATAEALAEKSAVGTKKPPPSAAGGGGGQGKEGEGEGE